MSGLYLVRLPVSHVPLLRFAAEQGIHDPDPCLGYTLHAWLRALFGVHAPRPFRFFERRREVLGYVRDNTEVLLQHAQDFGHPLAWAALDIAGVASKPMPNSWPAGRRLHVEVLACPVVRHGQDEKDAYLHALDQAVEPAPRRAEVYRRWLVARCEGVLEFEQVELRGMHARVKVLRRARNGQNKLRTVERPQVLFAGAGKVIDGERFGELLRRGIGRHRAFGLGMLSVAPAT